MNRRNRAILAAAGGALLALAGSCGTIGSDNPEAALFSRPETLLDDLGDAAPDQFAVFDRSRGELLWFSPEGELEVTEAVPAPEPGWGPVPPKVWRERGGAVVFAASVSGTQAAVGRLENGVLQWAIFSEPATVVPVLGTVFAVSGPSAVASGLTLPTDVRQWPERITDAPFAYLATDGTIALFDPVTGQVRWRLPVSAAMFTAGTAAVAWVDAGWLHQAAMTTDTAPARTASVPLPAAAVRLRYDGGGTLWLSAADGGLYRVVQQDEQTLCYVDNIEGGANTGTPLFVDHGALSSPALRFERLGRDGCPGWVRDDALTITFEGVPDGWSGVAASAVTRWSDLAQPLTGTVPELLRFEGVDGTTAVARVADTLAWIPPPAGSVTGVIRPLGQWVWRSARSGFVALAPTGVAVEVAAWRAVIDPGVDPEDRNDRFTVSIEASVDTFTAQTVFSDFQFLTGGRIVALDRRDASVTLIDAVAASVYGGVR